MIKTKEFLGVIGLLLFLTGIFFYKTVTRQLVPFPADVLVNEYQPWRSTSYLGFAPAAIPHKAQYPDTVRQIYPWKTLSLEILKSGKLPLWNPYNFSGTPLLANFQSAVLYPLNLIYMFTTQISGWSILVALQPLLATIFTYFFIRSIGVGVLGSLLASISFGFGGFMTVWLEYNTVGHVILWLPLILLAIEKLNKRFSPSWIAILALAHTFALLAGHPQIYGYLFIFSLFYIHGRGKNWPSKIWLTIISLLGIGIASLQVIPGIELIKLSARSPHDFHQFFTGILIQPWQFIAMVFPNFFGNPATRTYWLNDTFLGKVTTIGIVPLFFLPGIFRRFDRIVRWFFVASITIVILISANPISYLFYKLPLPIISSSSPTLMAYLLAFCMSILCGLGLDYWISEKHSVKKLIKRTIQLTLLLIIFFLSSKIPSLQTHAAVITRAVIYGSIVSAATLGLFWIAIIKPKLLKAAVVLMLVVHVADLFIFFQRFNPFIPSSLVFPTHEITTFIKKHTDARYWGYGTAAIPANLATQFEGFSPEGYDPLYPKWYGEFIYSYTNGTLLKTFTNSTRSDAAIISGFGSNGLSDAKKNKILAALSVGYILDRTENGSTQETFPSNMFQAAYQKGEWHIFKSLIFAPRAFLAETVQTYKNEVDFSEKFFSTSFDPTRSVLLPALPMKLSKNTATGSAIITNYKTDSVSILTKSNATKILVLTDTYYPGWIAKIDGKPSEIIRANWTQRALLVPAGTHTVTFHYEPQSVRVGFVLSMISIGLLILVITSRPKHNV